VEDATLPLWRQEAHETWKDALQRTIGEAAAKKAQQSTEEVVFSRWRRDAIELWKTLESIRADMTVDPTIEPLVLSVDQTLDSIEQLLWLNLRTTVDRVGALSKERLSVWGEAECEQLFEDLDFLLEAETHRVTRLYKSEPFTQRFKSLGTRRSFDQEIRDRLLALQRELPEFSALDQDAPEQDVSASLHRVPAEEKPQSAVLGLVVRGVSQCIELFDVRLWRFLGPSDSHSSANRHLHVVPKNESSKMSPPKKFPGEKQFRKRLSSGGKSFGFVLPVDGLFAFLQRYRIWEPRIPEPLPHPAPPNYWMVFAFVALGLLVVAGLWNLQALKSYWTNRKTNSPKKSDQEEPSVKREDAMINAYVNLLTEMNRRTKKENQPLLPYVLELRQFGLDLNSGTYKTQKEMKDRWEELTKLSAHKPIPFGLVNTLRQAQMQTEMRLNTMLMSEHRSPSRFFSAMRHWMRLKTFTRRRVATSA